MIFLKWMYIHINRLGHRRICHVLYINILKQQARRTPTVTTQTLHHDQQITENNHLRNIYKDDWLNVVDALHRLFLHDKQIYLNKINVVGNQRFLVREPIPALLDRLRYLQFKQTSFHLRKYNLHSRWVK